MYMGLESNRAMKTQLFKKNTFSKLNFKQDKKKFVFQRPQEPVCQQV